MTEVLNDTDVPLFSLPGTLEGGVDSKKSEPNGDRNEGDKTSLEAHVTYTRPESLAANLRRIAITDIARQAVTDQPLSAQEELGGGSYELREDDVPPARPLDEVIKGTKEWQTEIIDAVERFGLNELSLEDMTEMRADERVRFVLYLDRFLRTIKGRIKYIKVSEGEDYGGQLTEWYGKDPSKEELIAYADKLEQLIEAIKESGILDEVEKKYATIYYRSTAQKRKNISKLSYKDYQLSFRIDKKGHKQPLRDHH